MWKMKRYADEICDELEDAMKYAERYIDRKAANDNANASRYQRMAADELTHAQYLHDMAVAYMTDISRVYQAPPEMSKAWEESNAEYVDKMSRIKTIID